MSPYHTVDNAILSFQIPEIKTIIRRHRYRKFSGLVLCNFGAKPRQSFPPYTPMRIPCTCGCGEQVTYATKINHLNGRGKTLLRARVLEENESLKTSTRQQPALLPDHQKKKRTNPISNLIGNSKRLKVAQLEETETPLQEDADPMGSGSLSLSVPNEGSEIFPAHAHTDLMESPPTPVANQVPDIPIQRNTDPTELSLTPVPNQLPEIPPIQACTDITESPPTQSVSQADVGPEELTPTPEANSGIEDGFADALSFAHRSNRIAERTKDVAEQRWGNSHLRDEIPRSDHGGGSDSEDEDVDMNMTGDEDREDDDEFREDDDEDNLLFESDVTGISAWDLLGEGFEREVASICMFLARDSSVLLTIV